MRIARGVDSAGVGIKEEEVVSPAEDEGGFFPALRKRKGARGGDLNLGSGRGFWLGWLAGIGELLFISADRLRLGSDFVTLRSSVFRFLGFLCFGFMGFFVFTL